jgi:hypothetical protein
LARRTPVAKRAISPQSRYSSPQPGMAYRSGPPRRSGSIYTEFGATGLKAYSGRVLEEFLQDLQGKRAVQIYREMSDNDAIIGATLYAVEIMLRRAAWRVDPASETDPADALAADFVEDNLNDMEQSWSDTITEVLSFLRYGWAWFEEVYKRRLGPNNDPRKTSKYNDGLIGWRKLPIRSQESLFRWDIDLGDNTIWGMWQIPPPLWQERYVPMDKSLLFRTSTYKNNPEGRSCLRTAYRAWYFKRRLEEIEAIGLERDLSGLPILQPPDALDIFDDNDPKMVQVLADAVEMVTNIRRDELEGVVLPSGWSLSLLSASGSHGGRGAGGGGGGMAGRGTGGGANIGATIARYEQHEAMTLLADFILLGHGQTGTYALSSDKTDMFNLATNAWLDYIASVFNRWAIPRLIALNPRFPQDRFPKLAHDGVDTPNMSELGAFIQSMTGVGVLVPDPGLEDYVRSIANLPERPDGETDDEWQTRHGSPTGMAPQPAPKGQLGPANDPEHASVTASGRVKAKAPGAYASVQAQTQREDERSTSESKTSSGQRGADSGSGPRMSSRRRR